MIGRTLNMGRTVKSTSGQSGALFERVKYLVMTLVLALLATSTLVMWLRASVTGERPHPGWLYVVDSKNGTAEAQILLVDLDKRSVVKTFKTGMNPDISLAPDGSRLYISSTYTDGSINKDQLAVVNTSTGAVIEVVDNPNRVSYNVVPPSSSMALSRDGRWLYVMKYETQTVGPENVFYWVETFDTRSGKFLPEKTNLSSCGWGRLTPTLKPREVQVVCEETKDVRLLKITDTGAAVTSLIGLNSNTVPGKAAGNIETKRSDRVASGFSQGDRNITVMRDGRILLVDNVTNAIKEVGAAKVPGEEWVHSSVGGSDPNKVFVALSLPSSTNQGRWAAGEIAGVNISDSSEIGPVKTSEPFDYLALSKDGRRLYAVSSSGAHLMIIDATTLKEIGAVGNLGTSPSLMLEAP